QDINELQDAILTLVSRECLGGKDERGRMKDEVGERRRAAPTSAFIPHPSSLLPNLFCVGDVKQSIYRFRLAEPRRFLDRQDQFHADAGSRVGSVIDLQRNFRSRERLLEAINGVFVRLMTRESVDIAYDDSHRLRPGAVYPAGDGACTFAGAPIELHLL